MVQCIGALDVSIRYEMSHLRSKCDHAVMLVRVREAECSELTGSKESLNAI